MRKHEAVKDRRHSYNGMYIGCQRQTKISLCSLVYFCSLSSAMKEGFYSLIVVVPAVVTFVIPVLVLSATGYFKRGEKGSRFSRLVAAYVFSDIITKKKDDSGNTKWLLKDIELTDYEREERGTILSEVITGLSLMFLILLNCVLLMFYQLLLFDVSYSCDVEDKTKDCFEYKLWGMNRLSNNPIDCNSPAILNGTTDVVCYKLVFNAALAVGASYGTFKISMAVIQIATIAMLSIKQAKTICKIRIILALLYVSVIAAIIGVQASSLRVYFVSDTLANLYQMIVALAIGCACVCQVPWKDLIALKNAQNEPEATGVDNMAMNPV